MVNRRRSRAKIIVSIFDLFLISLFFDDGGGGVDGVGYFDALFILILIFLIIENFKPSTLITL